MSDIDRQRWEAVKLLTARGYVWSQGEWQGPTTQATFALASYVAAADALHDELNGQIEDLAGAVEDSPETQKLQRFLDLVQAYEAARPRD